MKFLREKLFGLLVLFSGILPLQAMQTSRFRQMRNLQKQPTTQTWGNWFSSFFVAQPSKPVKSYAEVSTSPFGAGGQRRFYSSGSAPKAISWGDWAKSFFKPKELTPEEFTKTINALLYTARDKKWTTSRGLTYEISVFDENDLQQAKKTIDQIIERNPSYKEHIMINRYATPFWSVLLSSRKNNKEEVQLVGTILDAVLYKTFSCDSVGVNRDNFCPTESELNYIKLAQHLIDKGIKINSENEEKYIAGYLNLLMKEYKKLYEPNPGTYDTPEDTLKKLKAIFKALDPLLEQVIFNKELKDKLHKAQQERKDIEVNTQQYRQKLEEEENKAEYMRAKGDYLFNEYRRRTGDYESYPGEVKIKVDFNEREYQDWLKSGKNKNFFYPEWEQAFKSGFKFGGESSQDQLGAAKNKMTQLLGVSAVASEKEISDAYRKFAKEYHPDVTKDPNNPMSLKLKNEINPAWDAYSDALKAVKQEKGNRE